MCKKISLESFKLKNYNASGISNYELFGECTRCKSSFSYSQVKKFNRNRVNKPEKKHLWDTCSRCWFLINTSEDSEWIEKNKRAQIIAQNKPEQKKKNAAGVSRSWTKERRKKASELLRKRYYEDEQFRKQALKNISWTSENNERYYEIMQKSLGSGGLKGKYKNIFYESALELSYIFHCEDNNINIKRYDLEPIKYLDENSKYRLYIPDFIINNNTIIEIKGIGLYYKKNYERNICKIDGLKKWCKKTNYDYRLILGNEKILVKNYKRARKYHHENKKKNIL